MALFPDETETLKWCRRWCGQALPDETDDVKARCRKHLIDANTVANWLSCYASPSGSEERKLAETDDQVGRGNALKHKSVMMSTIQACISGATSMWTLMGIGDKWNSREATGAPFLSEAARDVKLGKAKKDARAGITPEQALEIGIEDFCLMEVVSVKVCNDYNTH